MSFLGSLKMTAVRDLAPKKYFETGGVKRDLAKLYEDSV